MRTFSSRVTDIRLASRNGATAVWWLSLEETMFQGGDRGLLVAVTRSGTRIELAVTEVVIDADEVTWHVVEKPLAAGTDVEGSISARPGLASTD